MKSKPEWLFFIMKKDASNLKIYQINEYDLNNIKLVIF